MEKDWHSSQGWIVIGAFFLFSIGCILIGAGSLLRLIFPLGALSVGIFLYWRYPILYLGFTWWMWFLTAFVRRIIDYQSGWDELSVIRLSPYLVTLVTAATFWQYFPRSYRQGGLPFILVLLSTCYGFTVAIIKGSLFGAILALIYWLPPIFFGFHLFVYWRDYPHYRQTIQSAFLWGVLVMGIYGVVQYLTAPMWDRFWLTNVIRSGSTSFGRPFPLQIRVWSTMASPGPFSFMMLSGLLLLLPNHNPWRFPAMFFGYLALLFSLVRSAWISWLVAIIILSSSLQRRAQVRLIITISLIALLILSLTTLDQFSLSVSDRFQSLLNLQQDYSLRTRIEDSQELLNQASTEIIGKGLGSTVNENMFLVILLDLGWLGFIPYLAGMSLMLFNLFRSGNFTYIDPFVGVARATCLSLFVIMVAQDTTTGVIGTVFWGLSGLIMASYQYYQSQEILET